MNIIDALIDRIEDRLTETKNPCKLYSTPDAAKKVAEKMAAEFAAYYDCARPMNYIIAHIPSVGKWAIGFDLNELCRRPEFRGGYLGRICQKGFYTI